jgi:hypothetical protein
MYFCLVPNMFLNFMPIIIELLVLLSGLLPNPELETSVLSIWYIFLFFSFLSNQMYND